jgi:hypothetical protein
VVDPSGKIAAMAPEARDDGIVDKTEHELELAREGKAEHTPFVALGGLSVVIGIVVGLVVVIALLVWWLA